MGTNYYTPADPPCEHCGRGGEELHIGKASMGWQFLFAPYPELGLTSWAAWQEFLKDKTIRNEYGQEWSLDDLIGLVKSKQGDRDGYTDPGAAAFEKYGLYDPGDHEEKDDDGFRFSKTSDFS